MIPETFDNEKNERTEMTEGQLKRFHEDEYTLLKTELTEAKQNIVDLEINNYRLVQENDLLRKGNSELDKKCSVLQAEIRRCETQLREVLKNISGSPQRRRVNMND